MVNSLVFKWQQPNIFHGFGAAHGRSSSLPGSQAVRTMALQLFSDVLASPRLTPNVRGLGMGGTPGDRRTCVFGGDLKLLGSMDFLERNTFDHAFRCIVILEEFPDLLSQLWVVPNLHREIAVAFQSSSKLVTEYTLED